MPTKHGNKIYKQILIDPGKYLLLEKLAGNEKKITPLIKKILYDWIRSQVDKSEFQAADALDNALWQQSVLNRIDARKNNNKNISATKESENLDDKNDIKSLMDPEIMLKDFKNLINKDR
tara:strand:- start:273 stop:632 length:360 start_codon:yes stop_codon:yes gene_type:complete